MGALAMSTEPQTGSVTMLRKPATAADGPQVAQSEAPKPVEPLATTASPTTAQALPAAASDLGIVQRIARSKALWVGVAVVALPAIGASGWYTVSHRSPTPHATRAAQMTDTSSAAANSSGITPPDLGTPPAAALKQATIPSTSTATATPPNAPVTPAAVAPITAPSSTPAVQALTTPTAPTGTEATVPDTQPEQPSTRSTTSGEDQLFMEMSRKLTEMTNRIDTLEQKLDAGQHAQHDQLVSGLGTLGGRLDELRHREDTLEASQNAHVVAAPAAATSASATPAPPRNSAHKSGDVAATHHIPSDAPPAEHPAPRPHYTVQAGAPDIAILENPQGQPVRVQPGSVLDGWGSVTAITQSGSSWVVHTEHGIIR